MQRRCLFSLYTHHHYHFKNPQISASLPLSVCLSLSLPRSLPPRSLCLPSMSLCLTSVKSVINGRKKPTTFPFAVLANKITVKGGKVAGKDVLRKVLIMCSLPATSEVTGVTSLDFMSQH